ncbi:chaplin [Streptomyces sp. BE20]|uniref:chaplin n=1 Tax=Streptomyces sp. BE20 TaxID=3002525 RepID=UPI002E7A359E|nr:chaplin [Streptomyces sp. BE20]
MIKKIVVVAAAGGLVLAGASAAVAGSGAHHGYGGHDRKPVAGCAVGGDAGVANICGNTNVYSPNILGGLLNLLPLPPVNGGGGGGNNGGGNN